MMEMLRKKFFVLLIVPVLSLIVLVPAAQADSSRGKVVAAQVATELQTGKKTTEPIRRPRPTPGPVDGGGDR